MYNNIVIILKFFNKINDIIVLLKKFTRFIIFFPIG
jgi:hypothetical protein